jgi:transmembrane sensor
MPDRPQNSQSKLISEQAADWLLRFADGGLSAGDRRGYVRWLKASPHHVREMLEVASLKDLLRSADLSDLDPPPGSGAPQGEFSIVDLASRQDEKKTSSHERRLTPWHHWKFAASACLARIEFAGRALSRFVGIRG